MVTKNLGRVVGKSTYEIWLEQGNTGTEQEFLDSLNSSGYNVKDYGAIGDGITDDTEAFGKCIMEANGNPVIVPAGTYAVNHLEIDDGISINMIGINRPTIIRTEVQDTNPDKADYRAMFLFSNVKYAKITGIDFDSKRDDFIYNNTGTNTEYIDYMDYIKYKGNFYFAKDYDYAKYMSADYEGALLQVQPGEKYKITGRTTSTTNLVAFFSDYTYVEGTTAGDKSTFVSAFGEPSTTYTEQEVVVPDGCYWMGVNTYIKSTSSLKTPLSIQKEIYVTAYEWLGTAVIYFTESGANIEIDHCNFMNTSREAIYCKGNFENVHIHDCTFNDVSANFWSRNGNMTNFTFENNTSNRCRTMAVEFDTENGYRATNLLIQNNRFTNIIKSAVTLTNCHDVVIEGNYYSNFDTKNEIYSEYMGVVDALPYFVLLLTDGTEDTIPERDNCSNVIIRNNRGITDRVASLQVSKGTTVNGVSYTSDDVFFKNIEICNNNFEVDSCLVRTNCVEELTAYDNYVRGEVRDGSVWYGSGTGINTFNNVINSTSYGSKSIPTATLSEGVLSVSNYDYSDICSVKLSLTSVLNSIDMDAKIGNTLVIFVTGADLTVETSGNILNTGTITANSVGKFIYNGTKWVLMN